SGDKPGVPDVTKDDSTESESESWGNDDEDSNDEEGNDADDEVKDDDDEVKYDDNDDDKSEGDEDRGIDSDDVQDKKKDKTKVPVTSSSRSSDLASKFLNFLDIPSADTEIISPLDVHVHHEVPRIHTSTLLAVPVSVIPKASPVYTNIPQSSQTFTPPPLQSTPSPLPTTETINIPTLILDFDSVFRFNDRVIALEKDVAELKNDPLHTQVTTITEQVRNQLSQILPKEVSNFDPPMIEKMIQGSLNQVNLAKASSQPQSTYEAVTTLTGFELKKILIDKMNLSKSYLTALEHRECYDGLVKSYNLDKDFFSSYDVYSLKRSRDDKDNDEGPSTGLDQGLKKRKTSKDAETTTSPKTKDSSSRSSKGIKSQPKSFAKFVHADESEFEVGDTVTPQGQGRNQIMIMLNPG
nr:hypothetical protein [Tanacetum cinerariifolium]